MAPTSSDEVSTEEEPEVDGNAPSSGWASGLARHYSRIVDDESRSEKEREAALLYTVAESRLDGDLEDLEETLNAAKRARALFQELGDAAGVAHSRCLIAHARRSGVAALVGQRDLLGAVAPMQAAFEEGESALDNIGAQDERRALSLLADAEHHLREERADSAQESAVEALPIFRRLGDGIAAAKALRIMVSARRMAEGEEAAETLAREELERFQDTENPYGEGAMLLSLAEINSTRGAEKCKEALRAGALAQEVFQGLGDAAMEGAALLALAAAFDGLRDGKEALRAASDAVVLFRGLGDREGEVTALRGLALGYRLFERPQDALRWARLAATSARELQARRLEVAQLTLTAELLGEMEDFGGMLCDAQQAMEIAQTSNFYREEGEALTLVVQALIFGNKTEQALGTAERALQRFQAAGHKQAQAAALDLLAQCHLAGQDSERALASATSALELIRELGDKQWESSVLHRISAAELSGQRYEEAGKVAQDAISLMQDLGDSRGEAVTRLNTLVQVHTERREWEQALAVLSEGLDLVRKLGDREREAYALFMASSVQLQMGRLEPAGNCALSAKKLYDEVGDIGMSVQALQVLSQISLAKGEYKEAANQADEALMFIRRDRARNLKEEISLLLHLSHVHHTALLNFRLEGGRHESRTYQDLVAKVDRGAAAAVRVATELGDKEMLAIAKFRFAQAGLLSGRFAEALEANDFAMGLFREVGDRLSEGSCVSVKSQVLQALGQLREALDLARTAKAIGQSCKDESLEAEASGRILALTEELQSSDAPVGVQ